MRITSSCFTYKLYFTFLISKVITDEILCVCACACMYVYACACVRACICVCMWVCVSIHFVVLLICVYIACVYEINIPAVSV